MPGTVLIIGYHPACLLPVFGEAAISRLARLALSMTDRVRLWITPEIRRQMGNSIKLPAGISEQTLSPADMETGAAIGESSLEKTILVLPAHSLWDRPSLKEAMHEAFGGDGANRWYAVSGSQVSATLNGWLTGIDPPSASPAELLPYLLKDEGDVREAEVRLVKNLAAATQASDGLLARWVDRPLSRRISPHLARRRISPNVVTLVSTCIGFLGAWLLAQVGYWPHLFGALLFLTAVVSDGVDGEVARLSLRESKFGHYFDIITDNLVHIAIFVGMAVGLYRQSQSTSHLYALGALLLGFGLCAIAVYQVLEKGDRTQEDWAPYAVRWAKALNSRDFAYVIVLLAIIDRLSWFLWGAAAGTYLYAGSLWLLPYYWSRSKVKK